MAFLNIGRLTGLCFTAGILSACLPAVPVLIATTAVDGVGLLTTGKTMRDHWISGVMGQDCALWRLTEDEPVCVDHVTDNGSSLASGRPVALLPAVYLQARPCDVFMESAQGMSCLVYADEPFPPTRPTRNCSAALNIDGRMICVADVLAARMETRHPYE